MVKSALFLAVLISGVIANAKAANASVAGDFINRLKAPVEKVSRENHLYPSVMMAQAIVESDFGQSALSTEANNYFGIKGSYNGQSVTMATGEYTAKGKHYMTAAQFKKYPSVTASIKDNAYLLRHGTLDNPNYYEGTWTTNAMTASDAAMSLATTYATDMAYGNKLNAVIVKYNLSELDAKTDDGTTVTAGNINEQIEQSLKKELGSGSVTPTKATETQVERSKITSIPQSIIPKSAFDTGKSVAGQLATNQLQLKLPLEKIIKK